MSEWHGFPPVRAKPAAPRSDADAEASVEADADVSPTTEPADDE
jgi:hypothetical protein